MTLYYVISAVLTLVLTALILRHLIPVLKSKKMGQKILDIGPRWHKSKEGTPTMGGLSFIAAFFVTIIPVIAFACANMGETLNIVPAVLTGLFALGNGVIGMIDDRTKFSKGKNEGLLAWQKYLLQLVLCSAYLFFMKWSGAITTELYLPFIHKSAELGIVYYPIALILLTGIVNSVNLSDGIDGLTSSETAVVAVFFSFTAFFTGILPLAMFSGATLGCCLGFLVYNFHPARVFMGDTGSLFLGGLAVGMAFMAKNPLIILVAGFMYVLEAISDIIQVVYFKLTHGKRFFRMAPIHHHFEKCGWGEIKIVAVFSAVTLLLCAAALLFDTVPSLPR